jgi:hypothetical protein
MQSVTRRTSTDAARIGSGIAIRMGLRNGTPVAAPALYVANRTSADDIWAILNTFQGEVALAGEAALLGLNRAAKWALAPRIVPLEQAFARRRAVLLLPDSAAGAPPARCRYRIEAFQAALAAGADIVPVAVARRATGVNLLLGNPITAKDSGRDAAALRDCTRAAIMKLLEGEGHA